MPKNIKKTVNLFYELGTLRKVARSHRQALLTDDLSDNIASHSYRVTMIGWFLAKMEKVDPYKVVMMCLWHDTSETRTGDQNWINKKFVKSFEDEAVETQIKDLDYFKDLSALTKEYGQRETKESKLAKDADLLDQILLLKEYAWQGNHEAESWLKDSRQAKMLFSTTAKKMAEEILLQKPGDWWKDLWTAERRV